MTLMDEMAMALRTLLSNERQGVAHSNDELADATEALARYAATKAEGERISNSKPGPQNLTFDDLQARYVAALQEIARLEDKAEGAQAPVACGPQCENDPRIKNLLAWMNRRVEVEQVLLDAANGKRPLPTANECRKLAMRLGDPDSQPITAPPAAQESAMAQAVREAANQELLPANKYAKGWIECVKWIEHRAREIAEGKP